MVTGLENIRSGDILTGVEGEEDTSEAIIALRKEDARASEVMQWGEGRATVVASYQGYASPRLRVIPGTTMRGSRRHYRG